MTPSAIAHGSLQVCESCGAEYGERDARVQCAVCGGLLALRHLPPDVTGAELRALFDARLAAAAPAHVGAGTEAMRASGVWRFRELLFPGVADADVVSQPE